MQWPWRWRQAAAGLELVDAIAERGGFAVSHLLPAIRGEILARRGHYEQARSEYLSSAGLCGNAAERTILEEKAR